ncbi:putative transmembrane protein [Toxoplasma gondii VAND]|uniref:Putative transmembrane protein n=2 Tax=Toxoplasma gondii TaxID=5811 RepID=A0A086JBH5_TOXGO|nr:putative transmembrane protein [Toxoplasma gondii p89]KFH00615.1 putative transmembrane protein [Toxoplasma gondii VAND]
MSAGYQLTVVCFFVTACSVLVLYAFSSVGFHSTSSQLLRDISSPHAVLASGLLVSIPVSCIRLPYSVCSVPLSGFLGFRGDVPLCVSACEEALPLCHSSSLSKDSRMILSGCILARPCCVAVYKTQIHTMHALPPFQINRSGQQLRAPTKRKRIRRIQRHPISSVGFG